MAITFTLNGKRQTTDANPQMPLLWFLRDTLGLTGTKFGCGMALCGACTVHVNGNAVRSCVTPVGTLGGKAVTTIEGLPSDATHPVQKAWIEEDVPQCGYCQSGMIMTSVALLKKTPKPTDADIDSALGGHICRCGTYNRIRKAVYTAAASMPPAPAATEKGAPKKGATKGGTPKGGSAPKGTPGTTQKKGGAA